MLDDTGLSFAKLIQWLVEALVALLCVLFGYQNTRLSALERAMAKAAQSRGEERLLLANELRDLRREISADMSALHEKIDENQKTVIGYLLDKNP